MRTLRRAGKQRPPWFADIAFAGAHIATFAVGFLSERGDPSPSVAHILGINTFGQHVWAAIFMCFGVVALVANIRGRLRLEATAILCIAGGFGLWALMVFADPQRSSIQAGFAYIVIALIKAGWGMTLLWWTSSSFIFVHADDIKNERGKSDGALD